MKLWTPLMCAAALCLSLFALGCGVDETTDTPPTTDTEQQDKGYFNGGDFAEPDLTQWTCTAKDRVSGETFSAESSTRAKASIAARELCAAITGNACFGGSCTQTN